MDSINFSGKSAASVLNVPSRQKPEKSLNLNAQKPSRGIENKTAIQTDKKLQMGVLEEIKPGSNNKSSIMKSESKLQVDRYA